jgi:predicted YcjX-like family ATPase
MAAKKRMGRTIPSFRIALAMEKEEWKPIFRNALAKKDRKKFLMKCLTFLDFTSQHMLLFDMRRDFTRMSCLLYCFTITSN